MTEQATVDTRVLRGDWRLVYERCRAFWEASEHKDFTAWDVRCTPHELAMLYNAGLLEQGALFSNKTKTFRPVEGVELPPDPHEDMGADDPDDDVIPANLFRDIVGYEDVKDAFLRTIRGRKRVHHLLFGAPGTAKSDFLHEIERLPRSYWVDGNAASKAGLAQVLIEEAPDYLIIDEVDGLKREDINSLHSLCEEGRVSTTKFNSKIKRQLSTVVFVSANSDDKLSWATGSRFLRWEFKPYTEEEFVRVVKTILVEQEDYHVRGAEYIAKLSWQHGIRDVRTPRHIARLYTEPEEVLAYFNAPHRGVARV